jgi:predicted alpha/beta superfamily hydrolase
LSIFVKKVVMKEVLSVLLGLLLGLSNVCAQLELRVSEVPGNTPAGDTLYVAGNFNGWSAGAPAYALSQEEDGYAITFSPAPGTLQFKFTRGSWEKVEGNASGGFLPNRTLDYDGSPTVVELAILSWEGMGASTAEENVQVLSQEFYMPQLQRERRIWVYLPPEYEDSGQSYPVLYMQDGQNLFDESTAAFGEWAVDESLNALFAEGDDGIIVVGIDHGGSHRLDEYSPWVNPAYGGGEGEAYMDFIVETLKPHIDATYRTLPQASSTGIAGSSMGGLISLYGFLRHPAVFSKAGVFSGSFWFAEEIYDYAAAAMPAAGSRVYMIAGAQEGSNGQQVGDMLAMEAALESAGFEADALRAVPHEDGDHSEWYWRREFPAAYEWLFADAVSVSEEVSVSQSVRFEVFPNPTDSALQVRLKQPKQGLWVGVYNLEGKRIRPMQRLEHPGCTIQGLAPGLYFVKVFEGQQLLGVEKVLCR